jgi:hypothetical protein
MTHTYKPKKYPVSSIKRESYCLRIPSDLKKQLSLIKTHQYRGDESSINTVIIRAIRLYIRLYYHSYSDLKS